MSSDNPKDGFREPYNAIVKRIRARVTTQDSEDVYTDYVILTDTSGNPISGAYPLEVNTGREGQLEMLNVQRQTLELLKEVLFHLREITGDQM